MSSTRARALLLVLVIATLAGLAGCSGSDEPGAAASSAPPKDVVAIASRLLDQRARAVRHADPDAFGHQLGGTASFRAGQRTWYDNLTQLPIGRLRYAVDPGSLVREGDGYWITAQESLQLEGYDAEPVTTPGRFRLSPGPLGRLRLSGVADAAWLAAHDVHPQPWDTGPIDVREGAGVLGIFDPTSVASAPALLASVESGIADVSALVPYDWSRTVVVYALSDESFLDSLEDLPGDDPGDLDAVAFPVGSGTRFVLNPRMLSIGSGAGAARERDRLVRHELTHVAIGTRDDDAPVWLSEGLAEWVSVRPLAPEDRRLPDAALVAAEEGSDDLPDDDTFNDDDSQAHYGLAWWAVQYVADAYGDDAPWQLLDAMDEPGADPDTVLREQFGTTTHDLAVQADRQILALYGPTSGAR
ncbi:hypothetical protein ABLE68_20415 [Nocardioides sp. CN2-186]|uniref:hypothetical protein n=1 Tax=Nocardioides tweenelious TaxID=3156607 RepID=UPI0032B35E96